MLAEGNEMPPGMELGGGQEGVPGEMEEEGMQGGLDLEGMEDEELMELLEAVQGELGMRDQEDAEAEAQQQRQMIESQDAEHQNAMGLAEGAVAASKSKTASFDSAYRLGRAVTKKFPSEERGIAIKAIKDLIRESAGRNPTAAEHVGLHLGQHRNKYLVGAGATALGAAAYHVGKKKTAGVDLVRQLCGARPFVKAADAINLIPNRRYGIETDHTPGALEKNSDGILPHTTAKKIKTPKK
jgi:hypothetical protein